ncbi:MAG: serine hydrolase [Prevotellaceae bacterium]|jgi:beta-glucosidase-like glycosyl hydrolase/CubicO group peptidase (beta-lactamase class C family)|nr:serine hydrolase [Prevotellaceae bacterium]
MIDFKVRWIFICVVLLCISARRLGYSAPEDLHVRHSKYIAEPSSRDEIRWVDSVMSQLSSRERLAQLFMMPAYSNLDEKHENQIRKLVREQKIGGLIFFQGTPEKQIELTNSYQSVSKIPLLIGMDAEWGVGMRLAGAPDFPRQMALGSISDNSLIYEFGAEIARQCKLLGVHINFAPVVDVNNNPGNPVINFRSFGENQLNVSEKGVELMRGMQDNGVIACAKHFPGHGDTETDSHKLLPVLPHTRERLDSIELKPFERLINEGVAMIMIGHLYAKSLEISSAELPASISENIIGKLLRNEMAFRGLVISDALNMNGVKNYADGKNIAVEALKAGHDILLMPSDVENNIKAIEKAMANGEILQSDIDSRCRKVLTTKYRVRLTGFVPLDKNKIKDKINSSHVQALKNRLIEKSIILAANHDNILPFKELDRYRLGYIAVGGFASGRNFIDRMENYTQIPVKCELSITPSVVEINSIKSKLKECDIIIVGYHATSTSPKSKYGVSQPVFSLLSEISASKKIILAYFGSPYFLAHAADSRHCFSSIIVSHTNSEEAQDRTAQLMFGGIPFSGKMPVTATADFAEGTGIETYNSIRLKYVTPEELGIDIQELQSVDMLAIEAINHRAVPGCQILAAHKGEVFYHKTFGKLSYASDASKVKTSDIYDVASITKVTATLPLIMRMVDEQLVDIDSSLKKYLNIDALSDKNSLTVRDILLHQSGLPSWIPFHYKYLVIPNTMESAISNKKSAKYSVKIPGVNKYIAKNYTLDPKYFSNKKTEHFNRSVAANIYCSDELRREIYNATDSCKLLSATYRYSDLGFIYLQRIIETVYGTSEDELSQTMFYESMGMNRTGYLPLKKIDVRSIAPTENDELYRKQLLHGYVHDQTASLCGGVSGNAGLFSNANDLAKFCQMLLNGGIYGGTRYLTEETITKFTVCANCSNGNRRSLGFDKPEPNPNRKSPVGKDVSLQSYGHTGFTGTMIWIDPERELVFVFLSNRVHPSAENKKLTALETKTEILSKFITAIDKKKLL